MPIWSLIALIASAWIIYPFVGALWVTAEVSQGTRPKDAGFSFLPELIVFPPLFLGFAMFVDYFAMPWGRWLVGGLCVLMLSAAVVSCIRSLIIIRKAQHP